MSDSIINTYAFDELGINTLGSETKEANWPVVYQLYNDTELYVGETTNLKNRMLQHSKNPEKKTYDKFSVIFSDEFNKSVALDLESQLIQWFSGEGKYKVGNKNAGISDREYYNRAKYQQRFPIIWEELQKRGIAVKNIQDIQNSGLFKFSPYKRLSESQIDTVSEVLTDLEEAFTYNTHSISIIGGSEGTGKTIVIMYLVKLLRDLQDHVSQGDNEMADNDFEMFFREPFNSRFKNKRLALVIPNPSLKSSITKIFKGITNLNGTVDVLSPIEFGTNGKHYDVSFVDEAHLLKASNQEVHKANRIRVDKINENLFNDSVSHTELDWIIKKSKNVVMVYGDQRIRPNNITKEDIRGYNVREHILKTQMRSKGGEPYIDYLRSVLSNTPFVQKQHFDGFELKLFNGFGNFVEAIKEKDHQVGLSRLVAGFAWEWISNKKNTKGQDDIVIEGIGFKWNSTLNDWVGSPKSINEIGSIYTIQGYDLNYCGVIIGNDLKFDQTSQKLIFDRKSYFDRGAKKRNKQQLESNTKLTDVELLDQVLRTYRILMNRSIRGTYVYVCDDNLRTYLSQFIEQAD